MNEHTTPERVVKKLQDINNVGALVKKSLEKFDYKPDADLIEKLLFVARAVTCKYPGGRIGPYHDLGGLSCHLRGLL